MTGTATLWLTAEQQRAWRSYLLGTTRLTARLDRDLSVAHGLSLPEYEVMVRLSEAPERRLRMAELAASLNHSRSRLTHAVARMEAEGLLTRDSCAQDRRGVFCSLTAKGYDRLVAAAPTHVQGVRRYLVDAVTPEDFAAVGRAFAAVTGAIDEAEGEPVDAQSRVSRR